MFLPSGVPVRRQQSLPGGTFNYSKARSSIPPIFGIKGKGEVPRLRKSSIGKLGVGFLYVSEGVRGSRMGDVRVVAWN